MHRRLALALLLGLVPLACTPAPPQAEAPRSSRIVALGSPVTETLYALGVGDRVVGADLSSQHPAATAELPKVGYFRQFSPEGVLSLTPDLVLASDAAGPPVALERLRGAGLRLEVLPPAVPQDQTLVIPTAVLNVAVPGPRAFFRVVAEAAP